MSPRVALATCAAFPELIEGEPLLAEALRAEGVAAEPAVWDDGDVDWDSYDLTVVRCTWDYAPRRDAFLAWARSVPRLLNAAEVIAWNTDKRYLVEVPHAVPTRFLGPSDPFEAPDGGEYVIKPSVSAGSRDTARYAPGEQDRAREHVMALQRSGRTVLVQPYLGAVDEYGETALVFFAGEYSHAIRKGQMLRPGDPPSSELYVEEKIRAREPSGGERRTAEEILDALPWERRELLYARVDLIPDGEGGSRLVELELTEPSLFLAFSDGAPRRLAQRVIERL